MSKWVCRFSIPANIITDRGLQFTIHAFTSAVEALGTRVHTTTAYHPQSNGLVECTHRRLKETLAACGGNWVSNLPWVLFVLMNTPHTDDNLSPAQMLYRTPCTLPGSILDVPKFLMVKSYWTRFLDCVMAFLYMHDLTLLPLHQFPTYAGCMDGLTQ